MAFIGSPAVSVREFDASLTVPMLASSIVGMAGNFKFGPCFKRVQVNSENELLANFRGPVSGNAQDWFSAAEFLRYAQNL